ncbi:MAG TPA: copper chaperone [Gammaproteobacteria bacterium]|nr:copper chaperone [Gammaproteobacteria bacterium]
MFRLFLIFSLFTFSFGSFAEGQAIRQIVDIEVTGMTCPFCVYGTKKNLGKLDGVDKVDVSLEKKQARIVMLPGREADIEAIDKAITDAGFTPGTHDIHQSNDE